MFTGLSLEAGWNPDQRQELETILGNLQATIQKEHQADGGLNPYVGVPFTSTLFEGLSTGTMVMGSQSYLTYQYKVQGDDLLVQLYLFGFTVAGTPNSLRVMLPNGWVGKFLSTGVYHYVDNAATLALGFWQVAANSPWIDFFTVAATNWQNSTLASSIRMQGHIAVKRLGS